jgi:hypothetical protein
MMMRDYPKNMALMAVHAETAGGNMGKMALAGAVAAMAGPADAWGFAPRAIKSGKAAPAGLEYTIDTQSGTKTARLPAKIPVGKLAADRQAQDQWADAYIKLLTRELETGGDDATRKARRFVGDANTNLDKLKAAEKSQNITPRTRKALQLANYQFNAHFMPPNIRNTNFYAAWRAALQEAIETRDSREINKFVTANGGKGKDETEVAAAKRIWSKAPKVKV